MAGVAYLDPGNVASNMTAGARHGYLLVWVVVVANVIAWLVQYLSAKLGIVTGRSLPQVLGDRIQHRSARVAYWLQAELVAIATDLAEIIGGAVALQLLFGIPLVGGSIITGGVSLALLAVQSRRGASPFEFLVIGLMAITVIGFCAGLVIAPPDVVGTATGLLPRLTDADSVLLAASILGATIMPHAIYAHSALARDRFPGGPSRGGTSRLLRATRWDVTVALVVAGAVNLAILLLAASVLTGVPGTDSLAGAYAAIHDHLGAVIAALFAVGLLASGLASTSVGAYAGAEIMAGLVHRRIPMLARRLISLAPAVAIVAIGMDATQALVLSQVVLSFGIPFALIPLVSVTSRSHVLGGHANRPVTIVAGVIACVLLITLNVTLLILTFAGAPVG